MSNPSTNPPFRKQKGSSLIELLVGIAVGLMVVTAAMGTLVMSRVTSMAVTDQLEMQQQANTAMRIMTSHLRETNTRDVQLSVGTADPLAVLAVPPVFTGSLSYLQSFPRDAQGNDDFGLAYSDAGPPNNTQDCLGNVASPYIIGVPVVNRFSVNTARRELNCLGTNAGTGAQPIVSDVERLRVLYAFQQTSTGLMTYTPQAVPPAGINPVLVGLELCLELAGSARASGPAPGTYANCDDVQVAHDGRTRAIVRQTVRLRTIRSEL